jgi:hypothetical protein
MSKSVLIVARLMVVALCLVVVKPAAGTDKGVTATQSTEYMKLAKSILQPDVTGVTINSAVFRGDPRQIGTYDITGTFFNGLPKSGVVMSSGNVVDVRQGGSPDLAFNGPGDDDLTKVLKSIDYQANTEDAAVLLVNITVPKAVDIGIAYVFGSAEYSYAVEAQYSDGFGLFQGDLNVARIGNDPVSVKTVNCGSTDTIPNRNCDQLSENPGRVGTSLHGYTKMQIATLKLPVGTNQEVKIAVADARSYRSDSAVFVSFLSSSLTRSPTLNPTQSPTLRPTGKPTTSPTPLVVPSPLPLKGKMKMMGMGKMT